MNLESNYRLDQLVFWLVVTCKVKIPLDEEL